MKQRADLTFHIEFPVRPDQVFAIDPVDDSATTENQPVTTITFTFGAVIEDTTLVRAESPHPFRIAVFPIPRGAIDLEACEIYATPGFRRREMR